MLFYVALYSLESPARLLLDVTEYFREAVGVGGLPMVGAFADS